MKLTFIGAAHEVTGSCHFLQAAGKNILIDYGMEQGPDIYENPGRLLPAKKIDYVFLTHAHIDHSGLLPLLTKRGFDGKIFSTYGTYDLCKIMLRDSAHIQEFEAEWRNRKGKRAGKPVFEPLYVMKDADETLGLFVPCPYSSRINICEGIDIRFTDVGHLLGSASIEVWATEGGVTKKIVFSGDMGNTEQPIVKDPTYTKSADYVVIESTYGDRLHPREKNDYVAEFSEIITETFRKGGNVVIPSFAVGRTQELLYFIREIKEKKMLRQYNDFDVYLDSPLAIEATKVFSKNVRDCFDEEAMKLVDKGINPLIFDGLKIASTSEESKLINFDKKPKVIISASGMCEAGRIRHHLKHNLWRPECTVLFVGYQAAGTLGRRILDGEKNLKLFSEPVRVKARIETLHGVSGHADMNGLLDWLGGFVTPLSHVFVVHGEDAVTEGFASSVEEKFGYAATAPFPDAQFDLISGRFISEGVKIPLKVHKKQPEQTETAFAKLVAAGRRLMEVIDKYAGMTNMDKMKFEKQINELADRWDKKD